MARGKRRPNGEGTIFQRKDGRWVAEVYMPTTSSGRKRKQAYAKTYEQVREKYVELLRQADQGIPVPDRKWTVSEYLEYWLEHVVAVERRPQTYTGYEVVVRRHLVPGLGKRRLDRLTAQHVRVFVNQVRSMCVCCERGLDEAGECCTAGQCCDRRLSQRMVQFIHAVLRNALQNAVREEIITRNVAKLVRVPAPEYETGRGLSVVEAQRLLSAATGDRLYALYVLALALGLRRAELLGLRWQDVDLDSGVLEVRQTLQRVAGELRFLPPKTRRSRRTVPLPVPCMDALRAHRAEQVDERLAAARWQDSDLVFSTRVGTPIQPDNLYRHFCGLRKRADMPEVRFHDLRHTCVTMLLDQGVPPHVVRAIVGHSDIQVTMDIYAHASLDEERQALRRLGDRFG